MLMVGSFFLVRFPYLEKNLYMDNLQTPPPPTGNPTVPYSTAPGQSGSKLPSTLAFAVGILLFLLPFTEIKCNNSVFASKTGVGFVLGSDWKPANDMGLGDTSKEVTSKTNSEKEGYAQYLAIAALALALLGLLFSFGSAKSGGSAGLIMGILSSGALIALMFEVKRWFNAGLAKETAGKAKEGTDALGMDKLGDTMGNAFQLSFTPWFYIAIIAFLAAAFFSYRRKKSIR